MMEHSKSILITIIIDKNLVFYHVKIENKNEVRGNREKGYGMISV